MRFYPEDAVVPAELRTDEFVLRPLRASDNALDYDAVMASQEMLLIHSGGTWPREGFTPEENLSDLEEHERDHLARKDFTFTVMNPDETQCLGCVYITPLERLMERVNASAEVMAQVGDDAATVTFWVRQSRVADGLDARLLAALLAWFPRDWAFRQVLHRADSDEPRQVQIMREAGLRVWHSQQLRGGEMLQLFSQP